MTHGELTERLTRIARVIEDLERETQEAMDAKQTISPGAIVGWAHAMQTVLFVLIKDVATLDKKESV